MATASRWRYIGVYNGAPSAPFTQLVPGQPREERGV
jgi:hypothetical protein